MRQAFFIVCLLLLSSCSYKSAPVYSGVLYLDSDTQIGTYRLVVDKDRLEDIQKSFSEYAMFAYLNGIEDLSKNILIDENVITLDEIATSVYGKINDIERERIKQESLK